MAELQQHPPLHTPPPPPASRDDSPPPPLASRDDPSPPPPPPLRFDPSRMIGIIRRKALIKDLAAVYHAECLAYCQELLELQRKWEEPYTDKKIPEDKRKETVRPKETMRPPKRLKKSR